MLLCVELQILFEVVCTANSFTGQFDTVILNIGGGWVSTSNAFVAPQAGTYYLSFSFGALQGVSPELVINVCVYECQFTLRETILRYLKFCEQN